MPLAPLRYQESKHVGYVLKMLVISLKTDLFVGFFLFDCYLEVLLKILRFPRDQRILVQ